MNYHHKRRFPFFRIAFFAFTVAAIAVAPLAVEYYEKEIRPVAQPSALPIAGQSFYIAGQDAVDEAEKSGIVLRAQEDAEVGELVRLDASESEVDSLTWQIIPATTDFEVIEGGRRAFFSSRNGGTYLIIIAAAKDGKAYLQHHTIEVIGEDVEPTPENLASRVRRWAKAVEDYEGKQTHAVALAQVFRKLAEAEDVSVEDMLDATATANTAVLGDDLDKWLPLLEPLGAELDVITAAGQLETKEQYKNVWLSIAKGIESGTK